VGESLVEFRWQFPILQGSFQMEVEVNALMGAADEALWNRAGLFTSIDELRNLMDITFEVGEFDTFPYSSPGANNVIVLVLPFDPVSLPGGSSFRQSTDLNSVGGREGLGRSTGIKKQAGVVQSHRVEEISMRSRGPQIVLREKWFWEQMLV
jgi:hypothetical protein